MAKKIAISFSVVFAVVLAVIVFSLVGAAYSTDTAALLEEAKAYEAESNYGQAEVIYWSIVADYPGTDEAFQAQKNLAVLFITTGNYPAAQAEVDALIADFTGHQGLPQVIYDLANSWWYAAKFEESQKLFKYIVDNMPDSDLAIRAQGWVAGCDMKMGNYTAADQEIDALMKDFADNPQLTRVIYKLAGQYWYSGRYEDSGRLYQSVLERDPESDLAVLAKGWITGLELILGDSISCQDFIETIKKDCAGQSQLVLGWILYFNANGCWDVKKYKQAQQLYKYIVDNLPESNRFMRAKGWITGLELMLGNSVSAQQVIDTLIADCNGHPGLAEMVYFNAHGCWDVGKYKEARELYKYIADNLPESNRFMRAKAWVAGADLMLGNYAAAQQAIDSLITNFNDHPDLAEVVYELGGEYYDVERYEDGRCLYQHIIDNWPHNEFAARAQFMIGNYYDTLKKTGALPQSEANPKIEQAYRAVVEKYPDSPPVRQALIGLGWLTFKQGQWAQSAGYFQLSLDKSPQDDQPNHILYPLGRAYEELGQVDKAIHVYTEFLETVYPSPTGVKMVKARLEKLQGENR